jgi:hypothetical protein
MPDDLECIEAEMDRRLLQHHLKDYLRKGLVSRLIKIQDGTVYQGMVATELSSRDGVTLVELEDGHPYALLDGEFSVVERRQGDRYICPACHRTLYEQPIYNERFLMRCCGVKYAAILAGMFG